MTADYDALAKDDLARVLSMLGHLDAALVTAGSSMKMAGREDAVKAMYALRNVVQGFEDDVAGMLGEWEAMA